MCSDKDAFMWSTANENGEYGEVHRFDGIVSIEPEITTLYSDNLAVCTIAKNETIEFDFRKQKLCLDDIDDLLYPAPTETNCKNCGAVLRKSYCEYCGTKYDTFPKKMGLEIKIKKEE